MSAVRRGIRKALRAQDGGEMSLINYMQRNIEAKRPDDLARQDLQREIRPLPPMPRRTTGHWLLLLGMLGLMAGAAAWYQGLLPAALPDLPGMPSTAPSAKQATPAIVAAPVQPSPAAPSVVSAAPEATVATPANPVVEDSLRMADQLAQAPQAQAPVLAVPDPQAPVARTSPPAAVAPVATGNVAAKIEKNSVPATPRDRADVEFHKAEQALAAGRSGEALESLRAALKLVPGYAAVRQRLLRQLVDARRTDEAMAVLQEGLALQPAQTGWAMSLARLQLEQGDAAAADKTLSRSQGYAEGNADYAGFQGHLKTKLGATRPAITHYQRATSLAPGDGRWWLGLGLALETDGRAAEARDALRRALMTGNLAPELAAVAEQHLR